MLKTGLLPRLLFLSLVLAVPLRVAADPETEAEAKRLEAALARIQQAQASLYQQFQMAQELRRAELARSDPFAPQPGGSAPPPGDYNELQRLREARDPRIKEPSADPEPRSARRSGPQAPHAPMRN